MTVSGFIFSREQIRRTSLSRRLALGVTGCGVLLIILMVIAVSVGPVDLSTRDSMTGLLEAVGIGDSSATVTEQLVIERIRLPRIILAMLVGAALGISGAAMQSLFRNPLADPGIIGVSSGGALGAVIAISIGAQAASGIFALHSGAPPSRAIAPSRRKNFTEYRQP